MAPLFPILPALTVSVWVFRGVKTLSRPSLSRFRARCLSHPFFLCFFPSFRGECLMSSSCWVCLLTDLRLLACGLNALLPQLKHSADGDNCLPYTHSSQPPKPHPQSKRSPSKAYRTKLASARWRSQIRSDWLISGSKGTPLFGGFVFNLFSWKQSWLCEGSV